MRNILAIVITIIGVVGCTDGGHAVKRVSSGDAESVYLTHDNTGNPVIAWTERMSGNVNFSFAISGDDGERFSQPVSVPLYPDVATHAEGMPKIAFKNNGAIIVAYERKTPTAANKYAGSIYYVTSTDHGKTWSPERYIHNDTVTGRSRSYFDIETLPDGEVGASWLDIKIDHKSEGRSVRFAKTDGTNSFVNEMLIDSSACQCCRIDVSKDVNNNVYVAYRGLKKSNMGRTIRDMMIATSSDQGHTFTSPITISPDNWNIDGCPHTGPSLCSNKTGLFTMWYTEGSGSGVYYAHKSKPGGDFSPRQLVSTSGHHPQVTSNADVIAMLWEENVDKKGKLVTTINYRLIENGLDIEKNTLTPDGVNAFLPVVAATKKGFVVAYLMETENRVGVYVTRL